MTIELALLPRVSYRGREITGHRLRGLLALLAGDLHAGCSTARLVEGIWPDEQPENPAKALQILVSRTRTQFGSGLITSTPTGYRLSLTDEQVDTSAVLLHASAAAAHARAGDHTAALAEAESGLGLWGERGVEGSPEADPVSALRADRVATRRSLLRARALALSRLGRRGEALEPLAELVAERPRDEELLLEMLRCEADTSGPAAALARYEAYRRSLRDELGVDPGAALQTEHQQLLRAGAPPVRHGVVHEPNPLLGRDRDVTAVAELVRASRVTSVVGPGGLGKTRLAHAVSREAEQRAVYVVGLAGVGRDEDVAGEVASALGVGESRRASISAVTGPAELLTGIVGALGTVPTLLVLDNCEHVVDGAAELVRALVSMHPDVRVLTTSRAPLGLSSEAVHQLPELELATTTELFAQRARAARPGVELPAAEVEQLCRNLDGLPLAVELAAARVRALSVAEIARRLDDRFDLLRGSSRDAPRRHHTLHAVVDWSWNLLDPAGQAAMRALSVFPGGFTADAARYLLDDADVVATLEHLADQSLLKVADTETGTRFSMLETVREFGAARRRTAGEDDLVVDRLLAWARDFGLEHHEGPLGADPAAMIARIRAEQDNLALALRYGLARDDGATVAATTAVLVGLWGVDSNFVRILSTTAQTARLLSHFRPEPGMVEVTRTATTLCAVVSYLIEGPNAMRVLVAPRRLPAAPPDTLIRAATAVLAAAGDIGGSQSPALRALCASDEPLLAGVANTLASFLAETEGDVHGAFTAAEAMLDAFGPRGSAMMRMLAHSRAGELCMQLERGADAVHHLTSALALDADLRARSDEVGFRWALALANLQVGAVDEAARWLELAASHQSDDDIETLTFGIGVRAETALVRGDVSAGLRLWRRAVDELRSPAAADIAADPGGAGRSWVAEVEAIAVVAHARNDRVDLVQDIVGELPDKLSSMLTLPTDRPPPHVLERAACGGLLMALAMVHLHHGRHTGETSASTWAPRVVALAERFDAPRRFQPTMSTARCRAAAEQADGPAYADGVSAYAGLDLDELRAAALEALRTRPSA
ncbi:putative ATPase [Haloactinopolyspora alba]|uniref:Putative ATPase n=1 Tax=Haloactinopolyspora alba TaxID=648780 RepID=A0A2P8E532_9ACTN|nr:BTAD domain-containing putative transcriptional regulator [Haloactinopolyspora alba]PSL04571.1 putative ATPase [Haloactinopolyspora alba]